MLVSTAAMSLISSANGLLSFLIVQLKHTSNLVLGQHGYCPCPFNYSTMDALGDKLFVTLKNETKGLLVRKESRSALEVWCCIHCADKKHLSLELSWMPVALAQEAPHSASGFSEAETLSTQL